MNCSSRSLGFFVAILAPNIFPFFLNANMAAKCTVMSQLVAWINSKKSVQREVFETHSLRYASATQIVKCALQAATGDTLDDVKSSALKADVMLCVRELSDAGFDGAVVHFNEKSLHSSLLPKVVNFFVQGMTFDNDDLELLLTQTIPSERRGWNKLTAVHTIVPTETPPIGGRPSTGIVLSDVTAYKSWDHVDLQHLVVRRDERIQQLEEENAYLRRSVARSAALNAKLREGKDRLSKDLEETMAMVCYRPNRNVSV